MKHKTIAAILAFTVGYIGVHRFYLGEVGKGIFYIFLLPIFILMGLWAIPFIVGFIDGAKFLSMSQEDFDKKYNGSPRSYQEYRGRGRKRSRRQPPRSRSFPTPAAHSSRAARAKVEQALKRGKALFKDYDFEGALEAFTEALEADPRNAAVHFNLACTYSLLEHKDKGFYHLDRAVALGLDDFELLKTRDHLAYLRVQDEWVQFAANGFRLAPQLTSPKQEEDLLNSQPIPEQNAQSDLLNQLQQLAQLKEKGLLTEEEFKVQKEKLLR
ncbi:MAG: NINE protein [Bacteroidetes bacterium]|nr:MAG: NINE protein [Bacteroidota bacterium]